MARRVASDGAAQVVELGRYQQRRQTRALVPYSDFFDGDAEEAVSNLLVLRSRWIEAVATDRRLSDKAARIGIHLTSYLNRDPAHPRFGLLWPSAAKLAKDLRCDERTVQRAIGMLQVLQFIDPVQAGGGARRTTIFRLMLPSRTTATGAGVTETPAAVPGLPGETTALEDENYGTRVPKTTAPAPGNTVRERTSGESNQHILHSSIAVAQSPSNDRPTATALSAATVLIERWVGRARTYLTRTFRRRESADEGSKQKNPRRDAVAHRDAPLIETGHPKLDRALRELGAALDRDKAY